jgi:beta-lactamase class D
LAEKIEAANGSLELTAEEAVHLAGKVERAEWPFSDKAFREFVADVKALKSQ